MTNHRWITKQKIIAITLLAIFCSALGFIFLSNSQGSPIDVYSKQVDFQTYFPSPMPPNFSLTEGSVHIYNDLLFYQLSDGNGEVSISQQQRPPILNSFRADGFDSVATTVGAMLVGMTENRPTAILTTNSTLINISGYSGLDKFSVMSIGQSLLPVR